MKQRAMAAICYACGRNDGHNSANCPWQAWRSLNSEKAPMAPRAGGFQ